MLVFSKRKRCDGSRRDLPAAGRGDLPGDKGGRRNRLAADSRSEPRSQKTGSRSGMVVVLRLFTKQMIGPR